MLSIKSLLAAVLIFSSYVGYAAEEAIVDAEDDWAPYSFKVGDHAEGFAVDLNREILDSNYEKLYNCKNPYSFNLMVDSCPSTSSG